jgi:hypothetical protein
MNWSGRLRSPEDDSFISASPITLLTRSWQLTAGQIASDNNFRMVDYPGTRRQLIVHCRTAIEIGGPTQKMCMTAPMSIISRENG